MAAIEDSLSPKGGTHHVMQGHLGSTRVHQEAEGVGQSPNRGFYRRNGQHLVGRTS